jgi:hypothetical protein
MDRQPMPPWLVALACGLIASLVLQVLISHARSWWVRRRVRARTTRAVLGERRAGELLRELGFEIVGAQVAAEYAVRVNDADVTVGVRADYIVEKDGSRYVAEVKTGELAPRISTPATRRQLLEYTVAFGVEGILLVDAEANRVHTVVFPNDAAVRPARAPVVWGLGVVAVVLIAMIALARM